MSSRYGIRYSWYVGFDPAIGRYRFTRNTTSRSAISILPLDGLPLRDLHRYVIDARRAVGAIRERVLQVVRVVAVREVRPAVGAARLPSVQRAVGDRRRDIEHEVEFEHPGHLRVEDPVLVRHPDAREAVAELGELPARVREAGFLPEDPDVTVHELLHLDADARERLLPPLPAHEAIEDAGLLLPQRLSRGRSARIRGLLLRVLCRREATPLAEHEAFAQAVRPKAVRAIDRDARGLADRVEAGQRRLPRAVRRNATHDVMLTGAHRDRLVNPIEPPVHLRAPPGRGCRRDLPPLRVVARSAGESAEAQPAPLLEDAVRGESDHAPRPPRRNTRRLPADPHHPAAAKVECGHPGARAGVDDEARDEVLIETVDVLELHRRLEERVQDVEADLVRREHGALDGHPAERALAHPAVRIARPGTAPVLELDDLLRAPRDEELDRVLVGEEVGSLDRIERVQLQGIVIA